jgi:hypothetical protein
VPWYGHKSLLSTTRGKFTFAHGRPRLWPGEDTALGGALHAVTKFYEACPCHGAVVVQVGLPNVGKSSLFNALTRTQLAQAANFPFCTIEPNTALVQVPDARLDRLAEVAKSASIVPKSVRGLVGWGRKGRLQDP